MQPNKTTAAMPDCGCFVGGYYLVESVKPDDPAAAHDQPVSI